MVSAVGRAVPENVLIERPVDDSCDEGVCLDHGDNTRLDTPPEVISGPFASCRGHCCLLSKHPAFRVLYSSVEGAIVVNLREQQPRMDVQAVTLT